jgi:hypothetical protein
MFLGRELAASCRLWPFVEIINKTIMVSACGEERREALGLAGAWRAQRKS